MQEISQQTLERLSRHCPEAISTYLQCVNRMDENYCVHFSREQIEIDMSEDLRTFRNNIKKLARENLLLWSPLDGGLSVTLTPPEENA